MALRLRLPEDPRWLQLAFLGSFLLLGLCARDFPIWHAPLIFAAALATQAACTRWFRAPPAGYLSPAITSLSLTLLLRSDVVWVPVAAAVIAIAGKFVLRTRDRHLFNPANLGLCTLMLLTPHAWASPAQWGESALWLLWMAALGLAVAHRAFRADVSLAFLAGFIALRSARVVVLGQRLAVLGHQLNSGSLLLFTFFMISDPKTTPRSRAGRIALGLCVAAFAHALQFGWFVRNPLLWSIFVFAPLSPLFDLAVSRLTQTLTPKSLACAPRSHQEQPWNPSAETPAVTH